MNTLSHGLCLLNRPAGRQDVNRRSTSSIDRAGGGAGGAAGARRRAGIPARWTLGCSYNRLATNFLAGGTASERSAVGRRRPRVGGGRVGRER